jgi:hypothetical protein
MKSIAPILDGSAWSGEALEQSDWVWPITADDVRALETALSHCHDLPWHTVSALSFPLGTFAACVAEVAHALEHGRGIVLLRGLPVERFSVDDLKRIHLGISSHLGTPVYQSVRREMVSEIRDEGSAAASRGTLAVRGKEQPFMSSRARVQTTGPLRFHTDRTDIVGLLCAAQAQSGGISQIASATAIHNTMLERQPRLVEQLYLDLPRSRLGEEQGGSEQYYMLPVFAIEDGHFTTHYSRTYVEAGQEVEHVPRVSDAQWEALDLLQSLAHELCVTHRFEAGDIQFLNSHVTYHARSAYEDSPDSMRNLLRVWVSADASRPLPTAHRVLFGNNAAGAIRGGIMQPDGTRHPIA